MSVAVAWPETALTAPRPRHLSLVPEIVEESPRPERPARYRLTRRGRLVRTFAVVLGLALVVLMKAAPAPAPTPLRADRAVTVHEGQTLSEVAVRELPDVPVEEGVRRLRVVNDLPGTGVFAGQVLVIPAAA